jgi:chromosome segregation ATPase
MFSQKLIVVFIAFFVLACLVIPASAEENMDSLGGFLCQYAMELYKQGNINDAVYQLKNALALNPEDPAARRYLEKILAEPPAPPKAKKPKQVTHELRQSLQDKEGQVKSLNKDSERVKLIKEELDRSLQDRGNQLKQLNNQLDNLKAELAGKDAKLKTLEDNLQTEKKDIVAKQQEMSLSVQDKQKQLEELSSQMVQLEKEKRSYQEQLNSLKANILDLKQARLDYENRLLAVGGELKTKELMIQQLKDDKAAMLAQGQQAKQRQIARVEKLMKEIEDIFPDKQELKNHKAQGSQDDLAAKNRQLDKIDKLMREIEEVLPNSELSP